MGVGGVRVLWAGAPRMQSTWITLTGRAEIFKVFEASGCQAAADSAADGRLIQASAGRARIFGSLVVEKRSG